MTTKGKPAKQTTRIAFLVDESGSMLGQESAVIGGMNEFVAALASDRELINSSDILASVGMFDANWLNGEEGPILRFKFEDQPLESVRELTVDDYSPRGGTPLNDAIAETIERLVAVSKKNDKVMIVVMTDGMENSSQTPSERVREMIAACEDDGWAFIYLGADIDAWSGSCDLGLATHGKAFNISKGYGGMSSAMRSTASAAALYASSSSERYAITMDAASRKTGATISDIESIDFSQFKSDSAAEESEGER